MKAKKDKETKKSNIGVTFLTEQLLHVQVKLMDLDNRPETRHVDHETDELTKHQKWSSTSVEVGVFLLPFLCCHCPLIFSEDPTVHVLFCLNDLCFL